MNQGIEKSFQVLSDGLIAMGKRISLPNNEIFKDEVLREAHGSRFATILEVQRGIGI